MEVADNVETIGHAACKFNQDESIINVARHSDPTSTTQRQDRDVSIWTMKISATTEASGGDPRIHDFAACTFCCCRADVSRMWLFEVVFPGIFCPYSQSIAVFSKELHMMLSRRDSFDEEYSQW
jgi:hypothetical protein